ncbi:hypothetical protein BOTBODRAFT_143912 [Botryobasidium botryosum FD-172 SS1]|uniref:Uncharacterized protein n=1 Tax=Botryobasidium botryosum (strain FD-172 SS1) TaxID=930990 RepID=A0A067N147_BOTB1|nr:hypothetical protein BOTBODRAFT_143912 [Botryobasidium botryosum FD-172 SS1]
MSADRRDSSRTVGPPQSPRESLLPPQSPTSESGSGTGANPLLYRNPRYQSSFSVNTQWTEEFATHIPSFPSPPAALPSPSTPQRSTFRASDLARVHESVLRSGPFSDDGGSNDDIHLYPSVRGSEEVLMDPTFISTLMTPPGPSPLAQSHRESTVLPLDWGDERRFSIRRSVFPQRTPESSAYSLSNISLLGPLPAPPPPPPPTDASSSSNTRSSHPSRDHASRMSVGSLGTNPVSEGTNARSASRSSQTTSSYAAASMRMATVAGIVPATYTKIPPVPDRWRQHLSVPIRESPSQLSLESKIPFPKDMLSSPSVEQRDFSPSRASSSMVYASRRHSASASGPSRVSSIISGVSQSSGHRRRFSFMRSRSQQAVAGEGKSPSTKSAIEASESQIPLPALLQRAGALHEILEAGGLAYRSKGSSVGRPTPPSRHEGSGSGSGSGYTDEKALGRSKSVRSAFTALSDRSRQLSRDNNGVFRPLPNDVPVQEAPAPEPQSSSLRGIASSIFSFRLTPVNRSLLWVTAAIAAVVIAVIIVVAVVVSIERRHPAAPTCPGDTTGALCNLDGSCVCTSTSPGSCNPVSQSLMQLAPIASQLFNTSIPTDVLATVLWDLQGAPQTNCAAQSLLIDVGPGLDSSKDPRRAQWAQSALLYSLFQSQDLAAVKKMRDFVASANFGALLTNNGSHRKRGGGVNPSAYVFQFQGGYIFDFDLLTVTTPSVDWTVDGKPDPTQVAEVGDVAGAALNRMYGFAAASSAQRTGGLQRYWQTDLQLDPSLLPKFRSAVQSSVVLVPFDATSTSLMNIASPNSSFPPPIACFPRLSNDQLLSINTIESNVFGLPNITTPPSSFSSSCFPTRPVYGILDLLRLRLPFPDSRTGVGKQAAVLQPHVYPRVVVHVGETLSALPAPGPSESSLPMEATDPREYGTIANMDHVIFTYLQSLPSLAVVTALVNFVLLSPSIPPGLPPMQNTTLSDALSVIPPLEVAIFGTILGSDIAGASSSFTTPVSSSPDASSDSLFFGSQQGQVFRTWALNSIASAISGGGSSSPGNIAWTPSFTSSLVAREGTTTDTLFEQVWSNASAVIDAGSASTSLADLNTLITDLNNISGFGP